MILVVGSTGSLGTLVSLKLVAAGHRVAGFVRDPESPRARALAAAGVKLVPGDLKDAASLDPALAGVRTVVCTASATMSRQTGDSVETVDRLGVQSLLAAADGSRVQDFIFVSFASTGATHPLALAKQAAERRLRESRLNWTILQPACFCETWLTPAVGFDVAAGKVKIYGSGDRPVNYIALEDVAQATTAAVDNAAASRKVLRFGGATPASQLDAVRIFEKILHRTLTIERMSVAEIHAARSATTDLLTLSFLGLFEQVAAGFPADPEWKTILGVAPQTLEAWVRGAVGDTAAPKAPRGKTRAAK
jgi:uncharacterized protein YbjT (DUF2867 family)